MGTGALPASLSNGWVFQGEAGREISPIASHRQEKKGGREGLFHFERSPGETSGKGKKTPNSQAARLCLTG